ncbi:MAG: exodeoxyribonuclease VII large subunit [Clostridiales bacterium GWF2_38_85]|nr:MAG: exodeoxyribonuclease VII large subunit [Clostridiales bacterium GWF2_38_85]HBL85426.1 exodeoxyribonuclease VII large subunit [Clostridiales bacterium]
MNSEAAILSVSQINSLIKKYIEGSNTFKSVYVRGEISNLTMHSSGHFYFSLKDSGSVLKCIMFRTSATKLIFAPENGLNVVCRGRIAVYEQGGVYQLTAENMKPDGVGELYVAFEQLKKRLNAEGLFDPRHKKPLPKTPYRVGIVTSPTGAAIRDIIKISKNRFPPAKLILYPALVQGDGAAADVIKGIEYFNKYNAADVLIIGRGGGSIEDLWAFNDEKLARAIFRSQIPVVSAVGHETDFTIADFVADTRAATPSEAAQLCLPEIETCKTRLTNVVKRLCDLQLANIADRRNQLMLLQKSKAMISPLNTISDRRMALVELENTLGIEMQRLFELKRTKTQHIGEKITLLNPYSPLKRGYAIAFSEKGAVYSAKDINIGDKLKLKFNDGEAETTVKRIDLSFLKEG